MSKDSTLRDRAEAMLAEGPEAMPTGKSDLQRLLHELRVHRIELEMQNEALREAQAALQSSESKYRLLSDLATDCILWISPAGEVLYASPSCRQVFGREPAQLRAFPDIENAIHPEDRPAFSQHVARDRSVRHYELQFRILHGDGRVHWIEHSCERIHDEHGVDLGWRSSNRDITRRQAAEEELKQQSASLRQTNLELDAFNRLMIDRELVMVELKQQVNALCRELGKEPPYPVGFPKPGTDIYQYLAGGW